MKEGFSIVVDWNDKGRGRSSTIIVQDKEDMQWLTRQLLHADYNDLMLDLQYELPYKVHQILIFDRDGDHIKTPIACRG